MILYHFNLGYPFLDESMELSIPTHHAEARDEHSNSAIADRLTISKPIPGFREMCYFYEIDADREGIGRVSAFNHNRNIGLSISFDAALLDHFTQWKMMGAGEYALGLEPGNATPLGVAAEEQLGHVKYLEPGESVTYDFRIEVDER